MCIEPVVAGPKRLRFELVSWNPHPPRRRCVVGVYLLQDSRRKLIGDALVVQPATRHEQAAIVKQIWERRVHLRATDRQVLCQIHERRAASTGALHSSFYS